MKKALQNLASILTIKEKKTGLRLLILSITTALIDVAGTASIMPFIILLSNPDLIEANKYIKYIFNLLNFNNAAKFYIFSGCMTFLIMLFSLAMRALAIKAQLKYSMLLEFNLSKRVLKKYLSNDYEWFMGLNSASLGKTILSEIETIIASGVLQILIITSQIAVIISMMFLLMFVDPVIFLAMGGGLATAYVGLYYLTNKKIDKLGQMRTMANEGRYKAISEIFGGIKQIKISNAEELYVRCYEIPAKNYAEIRTNFSMMVQLPRIVLEGIAFGGIILLLISLIIRDQDFVKIIPTIALYSLTGYRVIPALQLVYAGFTQINFMKATLENLTKQKKESISTEKKISELKCDLNFNRITLDELQFGYVNSNKYAINKINLTVKKGEKIAIIGSTGSGKSTLVDLILGLLKPTKGEIKIGDTKLTSENLGKWQRKIGYVPQTIYLSDDSLANNIAFGIENEKINYSQVEKVSKLAQLHEFIINTLPNKYETIVGERGVRLSGGERQRIGIARALYSEPEVLILDEATSALDNITEAEIMDSVENLGKEITIIIIAHRLSTVKNCDHIYYLDNGSIIERGRYDDILSKNSKFKQMVEAGK